MNRYKLTNDTYPYKEYTLDLIAQAIISLHKEIANEYVHREILKTHNDFTTESWLQDQISSLKRIANRLHQINDAQAEEEKEFYQRRLNEVLEEVAA